MRVEFICEGVGWLCVWYGGGGVIGVATSRGSKRSALDSIDTPSVTQHAQSQHFTQHDRDRMTPLAKQHIPYSTQFAHNPHAIRTHHFLSHRPHTDNRQGRKQRLQTHTRVQHRANAAHIYTQTHTHKHNTTLSLFLSYTHTHTHTH